MSQPASKSLWVGLRTKRTCYVPAICQIKLINNPRRLCSYCTAAQWTPLDLQQHVSTSLVRIITCHNKQLPLLTKSSNKNRNVMFFIQEVNYRCINIMEVNWLACINAAFTSSDKLAHLHMLFPLYMHIMHILKYQHLPLLLSLISTSLK